MTDHHSPSDWTMPQLQKEPFEGIFVGPLGRLELRQDGVRITGTAVAGGIPMSITGVDNGGVLLGQVAGPPGVAGFMAQPAPEGLMVHLEGELQPVLFRRVGPPAGSPAPRPGAFHDLQQEQPPVAAAPGAEGGTRPVHDGTFPPLEADGVVAGGEALRFADQGFGLMLPRGWVVVQRGEDSSLALGGKTEAGLIVILAVPMRDPLALRRGLHEQLMTMGVFSPPRQLSRAKMEAGEAVYTELRGTAPDGTAAWVRAAGVIGPEGTVVIVGLTTAEPAKVDCLRGRVDQLARSVHFFAPEVAGGEELIRGEWWSFTSGSTSTTHGGTEASLAFCGDGRFFSSYEFGASVTLDPTGTYTGTPGIDGGHGYGSVVSNRQAAGRWRARGNNRRGTVVVSYPDGQVVEIHYEAQQDSDGVYFDGRLYGKTGNNNYCG